VIAHILGVPTDLADTFTGWVRDVLEFADDAERRQRGAEGLLRFFLEQLDDRRQHPADDLLSELLQTEVDGHNVDDGIVLGMAALVLIAGVDTTWSAIGSSLWHLAAHPDDRRRLLRQPELMPTAIEELLRAYSPVTMARVVTQDIDYGGCPMKKGDKVLMNFPAANRDPTRFRPPRRSSSSTGLITVTWPSVRGSIVVLVRIWHAWSCKWHLEEWLSRIPEFSSGRRAGDHLGRRPGSWAADTAGGVPLRIRRRPGQVPGPRPLLRPRAGVLRRGRLRAIDGHRRMRYPPTSRTKHVWRSPTALNTQSSS
jgi:hypothetical protein